MTLDIFIADDMKNIHSEDGSSSPEDGEITANDTANDTAIEMDTVVR